MLRSCGLSLLLWAGLSTAYYFWLDRVFDPPGSIIGAIVLGLLVLMAIGALFNARTAWREWGLAAAAKHDLPLSDGRLAALSGTIHPLGEPLLAPFSQRECVLCEYEITNAGQVAGAKEIGNNTPGVDLSGYLMNPCVVRTRMGDVRLLGFPQLEGFADVECTSSGHVKNAEALVRATDYEDMSGLKMLGVVDLFRELWSDDDGLVRKHVRTSKRDVAAIFPPQLSTYLATVPQGGWAAENDLDEDEDDDDDAFEDDDFEDDLTDTGDSVPPFPKLVEKCVLAGQEVTAFGIYSGEKRGLVPLVRGGERFLRLLRGRAEDSIPRLRASVWSNALGGLFFLIVLHAAAYGVMQAAWHSPDEQRKRAEQAFEAVEKQDLAPLAKLVERGMSADVRDSSGRTPLFAARDGATARWLLERGADVNARAENGETPLMEAARYGRADVVQALIEHKADLDLRHGEYNTTALILANDAGHAEVAELLRKAGASDDVITAENGTPLPDDGGAPLAAVLEYVDAIHARDVPRLEAASTARSKGHYDDVDWELWHNSRIVQPDSFMGFEQDDRATVTIYGTTGAGYTATWIYQLLREDGQWKVARERWDTEN